MGWHFRVQLSSILILKILIYLILKHCWHKLINSKSYLPWNMWMLLLKVHCWLHWICFYTILYHLGYWWNQFVPGRTDNFSRILLYCWIWLRMRLKSLILKGRRYHNMKHRNSRLLPTQSPNCFYKSMRPVREH